MECLTHTVALGFYQCLKIYIAILNLFQSGNYEIREKATSICFSNLIVSLSLFLATCNKLHSSVVFAMSVKMKWKLFIPANA